MVPSGAQRMLRVIHQYIVHTPDVIIKCIHILYAVTMT